MNKANTEKHIAERMREIFDDILHPRLFLLCELLNSAYSLIFLKNFALANVRGLFHLQSKET